MYLVDDNFEKFSFCNDLSFDVGGIDDVYNCISASIVSSPDASDPFLSSKIPCAKFDIFMTDLLYITADSGCCLYSFSKRPELGSNTSGRGEWFYQHSRFQGLGCYKFY